MTQKPHIVLVIPRGEAVRNFLYSDTLSELHKTCRVTVLSVVYDEPLLERIRGNCDAIHPLKEVQPHWIPGYLRTIIENSHDRWIWSKVAQNNSETRDLRARQKGKSLTRFAVKTLARVFANRTSLNILSRIERSLHWHFRRSKEFETLFQELKPDLVFNGSHIHGFAGELPLRVAARMGIKTAGFIFSWDNLTSRSRILVPYDYWFVWHEQMKRQLLDQYDHIRESDVLVTGTPQFDFHFKPQYILSKQELCSRIGLDPDRPFILYTTGVDKHFPEEARHVSLVIQTIRELELKPRPQLVVRTYVKGTSAETMSIATEGHKDVLFPKVAWDSRWFTPAYEDLEIYSSLVHHAALSINAASTVTLEFFSKDKPVINLDFDPPGSSLLPCYGFRRHIQFDHFRPVAESGGAYLARSAGDMKWMIAEALCEPQLRGEARKAFMRSVFGSTLDGNCGSRIARELLRIAKN
jgi:hypothetical protein